MSDFLHQLVGNLSTSEKVHFKRSAKIHAGKEDKNYLKIYEAVEKLEHYEKEYLPTLFKGTTIEKYLSSEIDYLKEKLLISLFNFNLNRTKRNQIQKGILIIEVLANKGFRKEALKKLKSIKKQALKQEEFTLILRLIELEEIIFFKEGIMGYKEKLEALRTQRNEVTQKIQNLNDFHILRQEVRESQFSKVLLGNHAQVFKEMNANPLIQNKANCLSIKAKEHWYYIQVLMSYLTRNFKQGLAVSEEYIQFMYDNGHLFNLKKILPGLSNYVYHSALTANKSHFEKGIKLLAQFADKREISNAYFNYIKYTRILEFSYYSKDLAMTRKNLNIAINILEEEVENLEESQIQYLFMVIVRGAMVSKNYELGMDYIYKWQQRGVLSYRKVQALLFSIIIHFELGHWKLIQSEIILLKKLWKENPREKKLIKAFSSFLNSFFKHPDRRKVFIGKFQQELKSISQNNERYFDFISFDYYEWSETISLK